MLYMIMHKFINLSSTTYAIWTDKTLEFCEKRIEQLKYVTEIPY